MGNAESIKKLLYSEIMLLPYTVPALGHCNVCGRSGPRTSMGSALTMNIVIILIPTQTGPRVIRFA